jgi:hypothetical protein
MSNKLRNQAYGSIVPAIEEGIEEDDSDSIQAQSSFAKQRSSSIAESFRDSISSLGLSTRNGIRNSLRFGGKPASIRDLGGSSTIAKSSFNLIKNLVGAGVLALPSGV